MVRPRVSHRLPTAALLSEGIAPVDRPWKTLLGRIAASRSVQRRPAASGTPHQPFPDDLERVPRHRLIFLLECAAPVLSLATGASRVRFAERDASTNSVSPPSSKASSTILRTSPPRDRGQRPSAGYSPGLHHCGGPIGEMQQNKGCGREAVQRRLWPQARFARPLVRQ